MATNPQNTMPDTQSPANDASAPADSGRANKSRVLSLWGYSRLLLFLGVATWVMELVLQVASGLTVVWLLGEDALPGALPLMASSLNISVSSAVLLTGSGILAYLAARNDREAAR